MFQSSRSSCSTRLLSLLFAPAASLRSRSDPDSCASIEPTSFPLYRMKAVPLRLLQADRSVHLLHHALPMISIAMLQAIVHEFDRVLFARSFSQAPFFPI